MKPFNPEQVKIFKTPKYGGVTLALLSMFVLASMMVVWLKLPDVPSPISLRVLCDDTLRVPIEKAAYQFEGEMKVKVSLDFAQSQSGQVGYDLYIPTERAVPKEDDYGSTAIPFASQSLVLATRREFSTNLRDLDHFFEENLGYAICQTSTSSGNALREALASVGKWEKTSSMAKAVFSSSGEAAISLSSDKSLDAIFIWDSVARQFDLRIHQFKEFENASEGMYAILGKNTKNRTHSLQFARFLAAPSKGQFYFAQRGFVGVNGDLWAEKPALFVYCANNAKDLILEKIDLFEEREHVSIDPHFLDQDNIPLTIGLIARSKAEKSLPDLVFGSIGKEGEELSDQFEIFSEPLDHQGLQLPVYIRKITRFPSTAKRFVRFLRVSLDTR
jgi:ABC-type molybdate transport system substrate-binding protein